MTKIVQKAYKNGYLMTKIEADDCIPKRWSINRKNPWPFMIYMPRFAEALWGKETWDGVYMQGLDGEPLPPWKYHLQKMVVLEDPIKYLEQFI